MKSDDEFISRFADAIVCPHAGKEETAIRRKARFLTQVLSILFTRLEISSAIEVWALEKRDVSFACL